MFTRPDLSVRTRPTFLSQRNWAYETNMTFDHVQENTLPTPVSLDNLVRPPRSGRIGMLDQHAARFRDIGFNMANPVEAHSQMEGQLRFTQLGVGEA
jgi:hypothetical protein